MFSRGGRYFDYIIKTGLNIFLSGFRYSHNAKFNSLKPFSLRLIVPPSEEPKQVKFLSSAALDMYVKSYRATLCLRMPDGESVGVHPNQCESLPPDSVYILSSPYFPVEKEEPRYARNSAKAFEDKSRRAMIRHLSDNGVTFKELDRTIKHEGKDVAEWEAIFEGDDDVIYFLECKHTIRAVKPFLLGTCANITLGYRI